MKGLVILCLALAPIAYCASLSVNKSGEKSTNFNDLQPLVSNLVQVTNKIGDYSDESIVLSDKAFLPMKRVKRDFLKDGRKCAEGSFLFNNSCFPCISKYKPLLKMSKDKKACKL